jgi:aryl sulfotransferase
VLIQPARNEYRTWTLDSRRWSVVRPRAGDIVIATAPKCGTTWMQQIVASLVFQDTTPRAVTGVSPWVDARFRDDEATLAGALEAQTHRRFLKTHLPFDGVPLYDEVRYIHVARDGRDAALSAHNHFTGFSQAALAMFDRIGVADPKIARPYPRPPADPRAFFRFWLEGSIPPTFFDLENTYWAERRRPNLLLVHFNDLKADLDAEMRRIASFLDIAIDERVWPSLVKAATFEAMHAARDHLMPQINMLLEGGTTRFFNKGETGRWKDVFSEGDLRLYEEKVRQEFTPGLAAWIEGGRRETGDPRRAEA